MDNDIRLFTETSENIGLMYDGYKDLDKDITKFLDIIERSVKTVTKDPKAPIDIKDDIDKFKAIATKKFEPDPIMINRINQDIGMIKRFKVKLNEILARYSNIKNRMAFGGNFFRSILNKPKVYSREIDPSSYETTNANIRAIDRALDWVEKLLIDLFNLADQDLNMLTIVGKVYARRKIYESVSDEPYDIDTLPDIMYFSSPFKIDELKGRVFLSPHIGISSIFLIDRFKELRKYADEVCNVGIRGINVNISYDEWGASSSELDKPLTMIHMNHNVRDIPGTAEGLSSGFIYTIDVSDVKDKFVPHGSQSVDKEVIYVGDEPLKILKVQPHTVRWELKFSEENERHAGKGKLILNEDQRFESIREIREYYHNKGERNMDEDDDLSWITEYLMEDVEPKRSSDTKKYKITHRKSKYKGWVEYVVHTKDDKEAASCIINMKTGDCADVETKSEYRRQGYMQYLLKYLVKFKGVKYVQVRQNNHVAMSLYRKIGFEVEFEYTDEEQNSMYSMSFQGDISKLIVEGYLFTEAEEPPAILDDEPEEEPKKESMPKKTDKAESSKNGVRRKKLYIAFIEWCKEYNTKNTFGSIFDKDAFNVSYPFVPEEMRYFYRLANPMLCVLGGELTFFPVAELRKLNSKNSHLAEMMVFAATPKDVRVFNGKDKKIYRGTEENGTLKLNEVLGDTFDIYIQKMINKGDILNGPIEESVDLEE